MSSPAGPYRLVTVNNAPERAKRLIGRVVEDLKDQYTIIYVANCDSLDLVEATVKEHKPDVLVCQTFYTLECVLINAVLRINVDTGGKPKGVRYSEGNRARYQDACYPARPASAEGPGCGGRVSQ
jgi:hypothetical protein